MSIREARQGNIEYLIKVEGSQSLLAEKLDSTALTQQRLSVLQRGTQSMRDYEAREIEEKMSIPRNLLDHDGWLRASAKLRKRYALLSPADKLLLDDTVQFVLDQCMQSNK
jgi:hypothetical protein